jgi:integrase
MQELAGHSDPQTSMKVYTHVNLDAKRQAVNTMSKVFVA